MPWNGCYSIDHNSLYSDEHKTAFSSDLADDSRRHVTIDQWRHLEATRRESRVDRVSRTDQVTRCRVAKSLDVMPAIRSIGCTMEDAAKNIAGRLQNSSCAEIVD